jgi:hypothetical protein
MKYKPLYCIEEGRKLGHKEMASKEHCRRQCENMSIVMDRTRAKLDDLWNKSVPTEAPSKERD